ncbi:MAG: hypothetical protein MJA32_05880 [Proteobacteria bacterium]|nr:hypothetical protein [Pseudomonadota bacterium]
MKSFLKQWLITESTTRLIEAGDRLDILPTGDPEKLEFRCRSQFTDSVSGWKAVDDCTWCDLPSSEGYLKATVQDPSGGIYAIAVRHSLGRPDRIRIEAIGPIANERGSMAKTADREHIGSRWAIGKAAGD